MSVRFGIVDRQRGIEEIAAWSGEHPGVPPGRRLRYTQMLTVDDRTAVVTTLFGYPDCAVEAGRPSAGGSSPRTSPRSR